MVSVQISYNKQLQTYIRFENDIVLIADKKYELEAVNYKLLIKHYIHAIIRKSIKRKQRWLCVVDNYGQE